ncbi:MAG: alcohol dehydrogenase catalytic domain-containing protein [Anaerolineales bacterium]|nr:alcohol dehydrogenase catalytic domain-containing protein [Anaerolineales bacterium]
MKGLWLENQQLIFRDDLPVPFVGDGEALIKVHLAGICATDLEMLKGYYPFTGIPGHEFVGEVVKTDRMQDLVGKRVVGEINIPCGACDQCLRGNRDHCRERKVLGIKTQNGVFAEFFTIPEKNLHVVPDGVNDEMAVFTEPLAAALEIQQQVHIHPEDHVLLVGAGRLGQLIAQTLAICPCRFHAATRYPTQSELLLNKGINTIDEDQTPMGMMDVVIEATGSPQGFALARKAVRPGGVMVIKSTYKGDLHVNMSSIVVDEITVIGSRCGPFSPALRLLEGNLVDPTPLIDSIFEIESSLAAFEQATKPGVYKVLIKF